MTNNNLCRECKTDLDWMEELIKSRTKTCDDLQAKIDGLTQFGTLVVVPREPNVGMQQILLMGRWSDQTGRPPGHILQWEALIAAAEQADE